MVAIIAKVVGSLSTAILTYASVRNMLETTQITSLVQNEKDSIEKILEQRFDPLLTQYISNDDSGNLIVCPKGKCSTEIIEDLKKMKRKDLLLLFLLCDSPLDEKDIHGDWDGVLLNNNSVLTTVSGFITNQLFGRKYGNWRGKAFGSSDSEGSIGINRFNDEEKGSDAQTAKITKEHSFAYSITDSTFLGKGVLLDYCAYQGLLSPWKSMKDEVRLLKAPTEREGDSGVLLGVGSLGWSGGFLNSQPFCLIQE